MELGRTSLPIVTLTVAMLALSACAALGDQSDTHHPAQTSAAQEQPEGPGLGVGVRMGTPAPAYGEQIKAMRQMHEKMLAANTPAERNALMAAQMTLMQKGMNLAGGMGGSGTMGSGAATGQPGDMAAWQGTMEQRMEMMHSMMQMSMDRMSPGPDGKMRGRL